MEIWKDIVGYNGLYQISNCGRVKSFHNNSKRILKPKTNNKGYKWVILNLNKITQNCLIHRLVAEHFIENPKNYKIINHIDENPSNNNVSNLEWCTYSQNTMKSSKVRSYNEFCKMHPITRNGKNGDTHKEIQQILNGTTIKVFKNSIEVERCFGFDKSFILSVCRNKRKSAYGYQWQFV